MSKTAIVIGGGPGGLVTAHALASRKWQVTVLERADYPKADVPGPQARRGAPQSHCLHMLMGAGAAAFDTLVPGWQTAIMRHGAVPFDALRDAAMQLPAGWLPRTTSGITMYACSRTLLERVLHQELLRRSHVQVLQTRQVVGLQIRDGRATGVQTDAGKTLDADLVVDVSGTATRLPHWLEDAAQGAADARWPETVVTSPWHYVSRWFRLEPNHAPDWHCLTAAPRAGAGRAAMMLRAEDDFWNVVLLGRDGSVMPQDDAAFLGFTADLADGRLNAALQRAVPASPIHHYGRTTNRMRHANLMPGWPMGLAALGDSVLTLDPYFGLGMTNAARGAVLLGTHLDRAGNAPLDAAQFQNDLAQLNAAPWRLVTGQHPDGAPVQTDGHAVSRLYAAAPASPDIARAILEVQHLLRPEDSLTKGIAA